TTPLRAKPLGALRSRTAVLIFSFSAKSHSTGAARANLTGPNRLQVKLSKHYPVSWRQTNALTHAKSGISGVPPAVG
ncbi:MAG TPA: hypothetical protein VFE27_21355, partial [Acidobacteriaceae bacterium]|nr:hypothetical protein [Acidobacteriaceae bacterium]